MISESYVAPIAVDDSTDLLEVDRNRPGNCQPIDVQQVIEPYGRTSAQLERAVEGALRGQSRRNQLLPWAWNHLTPADLEHVANTLWNLPANSTSLEKEAAFGLAAILTTGRRLSYLISLPLLTQTPQIDLTTTEAVVVGLTGEFVWNLIGGSPSRQAARRPRVNMSPGEYAKDKDSPVRLPLAPVARHCLERLLELDAATPRPLFAYGHKDLETAIETLLSLRRKDTGPPRRASRTLESAERFLTAAINHQSGGDIGDAARMTDSDETMSRTVMHYGVTRMSSTVRRAQDATDILNDGRPSPVIEGLDAGEVGNTRTPGWRDVKALVAACTEWLENEQEDDDRNHLAMTCYTVALLSYATGHRGLGEPLPLTNAVDRITGFCKLHEKGSNPSEARLIWIAPVAARQMVAFEEHLASLKPNLLPRHFDEISKMVRSGRLPLFSIVNRRAKKFTLTEAWKIINEEAGNLPREFVWNSGRHWLRSELSGYCSTETVHAFFGHKQVGTEPWAMGSCFDPLLYRADLDARLTGLLSRVGWRALDARARPR